MNMDAFWCITLGMIIIRWWWKSINYRKPRKTKNVQMAQIKLPEPISQEEMEKRKKERELEKNRADLRKQGYSEELITLIEQKIVE